MDGLIIVAWVLAGSLGVGLLAAVALWRGEKRRGDALAREAAAARGETAEVARRLSEAEKDAAALTERVAGYDLRVKEEVGRQAAMEARLREMFGSLAADALKNNSGEFMKLAGSKFETLRAEAAGAMEERKKAVEALVKPISETLGETKKRLESIEQSQAAHRASFAEQAQALALGTKQLRDETGRLTNALSSPNVRGRYGEMQLKRVAELSGMRSYCDFDEQPTHSDGEGRRLRPDMVVRLPNERVIAVDAKTNTQAYLEAAQARTPEEAESCMQQFARHVLDQAGALAKKEYRESVQGSLDFVVMFIPGDQLVDAALEREPSLLDFAAEKGVIIASPSTLIGLLRAVAVGWRERSLTDNAEELFKLGKELHERAVKALEHAAEVGEALDKACRKYNQFAGSMQNRFVTTLRKFEDLGGRSGKEVVEVKQIETAVREVEVKALPGAVGAVEAQ